MLRSEGQPRPGVVESRHGEDPNKTYSMDRHIAKEFANRLLDVCQECDTETISLHDLIDPKVCI